MQRSSLLSERDRIQRSAGSLESLESPDIGFYPQALHWGSLDLIFSVAVAEDGPRKQEESWSCSIFSFKRRERRGDFVSFNVAGLFDRPLDWDPGY